MHYVAAFRAKAPTADVRNAADAVASGHKALADISFGSRGSAVSEEASVLKAVLASGAAHSIVSGGAIQPFSIEASSKCCAESALAGHPSDASTTKLVAFHGQTNTAVLKSTSCCKSQHSFVSSFCEPDPKPDDECIAVHVNGFSSKSQCCSADSSSELCDAAAFAHVRNAVVSVAFGHKDRVDVRSGSPGSTAARFLTQFLRAELLIHWFLVVLFIRSRLKLALRVLPLANFSTLSLRPFASLVLNGMVQWE